MLQNVSAANQTKFESLSKETRILERKLSRSLLLTFTDELAVIMCSKSNENNEQTEIMLILIQTSDVQANLNIAKHAIDGEADAVVSSNIDFSMCVGCNK